MAAGTGRCADGARASNASTGATPPTLATGYTIAPCASRLGFAPTMEMEVEWRLRTSRKTHENTPCEKKPVDLKN